MKKHVFLLILCLYTWIFTQAQTLTLQGRVIDGTSQLGIPYTNIGFPSFGIGTSSNEMGDFVIKIPREHLNDTLFFSSIGYITFKLLPKEITGSKKDLTITLKSNNINLDEFVVKSLDAKGIIKKFMKNRTVNYATEPALLKVFCRETMKNKDSDQYFASSEGILEVYKSSIKKNDDHVRLIKGRKKNLPTIYRFKSELYPLPNVVNGPSTAIILDIVKNSDFFLLKNYQFQFIHTGFESINDRLAYVLSFSPIDSSMRALYPSDFDFYKGQVYIDTATFAVVRADFEMSSRGIRVVNLDLKTPIRLEKRTFVINYSEYNDKNYFKSANVENTYFYPKANLRLTHKMESFVTEIKTDSVKKFDSHLEIRTNQSLGEKIARFDDSFWEEYNFIKSTEKDSTMQSVEQDSSDTPSPEGVLRTVSSDETVQVEFVSAPQETLPIQPLSTNKNKVIFTKLSYDDALKLATKQHKAVYIDFYADWCGPCKKMEASAFTDPEISEKLNTFFINYKADVDRGEGKMLSQRFAVQGMPTILFIDSLGKTLYREMGFSSTAAFAEQLNAVLTQTQEGLYYSLLEKKLKAYKKPPVDFMTSFLGYRNALGMNNKLPLDKYVASLPSDSLMLDVNERLILKYAVDLEGKTFNYLLKNKDNPTFKFKLKSMLFINLKEAIEEKDKRYLAKILKANESIETDPSVWRIENAIFTIDFYRKTGDEKHFHEAVMDFLKDNKSSTSDIVQKKMADLSVYYKQKIKNEKWIAEFDAAVK